MYVHHGMVHQITLQFFLWCSSSKRNKENCSLLDYEISATENMKVFWKGKDIILLSLWFCLACVAQYPVGRIHILLGGLIKTSSIADIKTKLDSFFVVGPPLDVWQKVIFLRDQNVSIYESFFFPFLTEYSKFFIPFLPTISVLP